jgi:type I restriction enzyme S subunit
MSTIIELLEGVEVEWTALGEVIKSLKTGLNPRKNFQLNTSDAKNFYVTVREIQNGKIVFLDKTDRVNDRALDLISNRSNLEVGDILFSGTGTVGRTAVVEIEPENWNVKEGVYLIKPDQEIINPRYLLHLLNAQYIVKEYSKRIVGSPVVSLPMSELKKLQIPIPPLDIQAEIVRILDNFTELTARKKQYNYYRDQLLTFEEGQAEWKTLGELCSISVGQATNDNEIGQYPFVNAGTTPSGYLSTFNTEPDTITTPSRGQGGIVFVGYQTTRFWCGPLCYRIRSTNKIITTRFLYYVMSNSMKNIIELANMAGVPALNKKELVGFPVPIPPLAEQDRIVSILDKFDALTNSITEGLPREIELCQQQYAYYRELLLSFPKAEGEAPDGGRP